MKVTLRFFNKDNSQSYALFDDDDFDCCQVVKGDYAVLVKRETLFEMLDERYGSSFDDGEQDK